MLVKEMEHVDHETLDRIQVEKGFKFYWEVINFLVDYYKKEERLKKEVSMTLGKVDYD